MTLIADAGGAPATAWCAMVMRRIASRPVLVAILALWAGGAAAQNAIVTATQTPGVVPISPYGSLYPYPYPYPYGAPYATNNPSVQPIVQPQQADPLSAVPTAPSIPGATSLPVSQPPSSSSAPSAAPATSSPSSSPADNANNVLLRDPGSPLYQRYDNLNAARGRIRDEVLQEAARGVGTRRGFAEEIQRIDASLEKTYGQALDEHYDFRAVIIDAHVVPPVIMELHKVREQGGERLLYLTLGAFEIVKPARLVIAPPSWRDYLDVSAAADSLPSTVAPQDTREQSIWDAALADGLVTGIHEARATFEENLNRLDRDYQGMVRYHELARQGAISLPKINVSARKVRITDNGTRAFIGEQILTLRIMPKFRAARAAAFR